MNELQLVKSANFGEVICDFYSDGTDYYLTRQQIGQALEYSYPQESIQKIHDRNKERLDNLSTQVKLTGVDGKRREHTVYTRKGVMEVCRHSGQPKANAFMDFVWDTMDDLFSGKTVLLPNSTKKAPSSQNKRLEIQEKNARIRASQTYLRIAENAALPKEYKHVLLSYATKELSGQEILPLPKNEEKTFTATDISKETGLSIAMIGKLANANGLKVSEYGIEVWDKAAHSAKQVPSWRYNEAGKQRLLELCEKRNSEVPK